MDDREDHADDGERPNEVVGPAGCDATAAECDADRKDQEKSNADHVEGTWRDEVAESFPVEPMNYVISPDDGLPIEANPVQLSTAPAFTRENCVCVEDTSRYVELFVEDLLELGWKKCWTGAWRMPSGRKIRIDVRHRFSPDGFEQRRSRWKPSKVEERYGELFVHGVPVRPLRLRCRYYKRQLWLDQEMSDKDRQVKVASRNCSERRTLGGAFLSVSNEAIFACDYRDPPDPKSVRKHLDDWDNKALNGPAPELVPLFAASRNTQK